MQEKLIIFDVASPLELEKALDQAPQKQNDEIRFAELRLFGPQVLVRNFELPPASNAAIRNILKLECAELLSLEQNEIELDYQITHVIEGQARGTYVAVPRKILKEYLACFDKSDMIPVKITAQIISRSMDFLKNGGTKSRDFCLLDLFKNNIVNLSVFLDGRLELSRPIYYDSQSQAEQEIIHSLRYTHARSSSKQISEIHFSGDLAERQGLISSIKEKVEVGQEKVNEIPGDSDQEDLFLDLNLMKRQGMTLSLRNNVLQAQRLAIAVLSAACLFLAVISVSNGIKIRKLRASFSASNYKYAQSLQEKINSLRHEK